MSIDHSTISYCMPHLFKVCHAIIFESKNKRKEPKLSDFKMEDQFCE